MYSVEKDKHPLLVWQKYWLFLPILRLLCNNHLCKWVIFLSKINIKTVFSFVMIGSSTYNVKLASVKGDNPLSLLHTLSWSQVNVLYVHVSFCTFCEGNLEQTLLLYISHYHMSIEHTKCIDSNSIRGPLTTNCVKHFSYLGPILLLSLFVKKTVYYMFCPRIWVRIQWLLNMQKVMRSEYLGV